MPLLFLIGMKLARFRCTKTSVNKRLLLCNCFFTLPASTFALSNVPGRGRTAFHARGGSEGLYSYRKRVDVLHYAVLAENERLVVTTMLLNNATMGNFQRLIDFGF